MISGIVYQDLTVVLEIFVSLRELTRVYRLLKRKKMVHRIVHNRGSEGPTRRKGVF